MVRSRDRLTAIEVKSGPSRNTLAGMGAFSAAFHPDRPIMT